MKFPSSQVCPHILLNVEMMKLAEYWGQETSNHSVDIMRKKGPVSENERNKDLSIHNLSVKGEFAVDIFLHKNVEEAIKKLATFLHQ